jgi:pantoate--beta-alanine ligase
LEILDTPLAMQARSREWRREGLRIAIVPTMGALHEGHLRLLREARDRADRLVASIFVNPTQFDRASDLATYPRTFEDDCRGAEAAGVDVVFAPTGEGMYPEGFQTHVEVEGVSRTLCGATRPGHFRGVATVVLKLFNIVQPDVAVFGWKDAQQFILLSRMVEDLNLPVEMVGAETVREPDGLAMSSRNKNLTPEQRAAAPRIYRGLEALRAAAETGERQAGPLLAVAREVIEREHGIEIQYLEMVSQRALEPLDMLEPGNTLVAVAAFLGPTRLIDNLRL